MNGKNLALNGKYALLDLLTGISGTYIYHSMQKGYEWTTWGDLTARDISSVLVARLLYDLSHYLLIGTVVAPQTELLGTSLYWYAIQDRKNQTWTDINRKFITFAMAFLALTRLLQGF